MNFFSLELKTGDWLTGAGGVGGGGGGGGVSGGKSTMRTMFATQGRAPLELQ